MFTKKRFTALVVVTLLTTKASTKVTCQSRCQCKTATISCIDKGLQTIPKGIPLTARKIYLSNNPQIKIPSDYFLQFKHLSFLSLNNCGQRGPIYLPDTINELRLDKNMFTVGALKEMFSPTLQFLKRISLETNRLSMSDTKAVLSVARWVGAFELESQYIEDGD